MYMVTHYESKGLATHRIVWTRPVSNLMCHCIFNHTFCFGTAAPKQNGKTVWTHEPILTLNALVNGTTNVTSSA